MFPLSELKHVPLHVLQIFVHQKKSNISKPLLCILLEKHIEGKKSRFAKASLCLLFCEAWQKYAKLSFSARSCTRIKREAERFLDIFFFSFSYNFYESLSMFFAQPLLSACDGQSSAGRRLCQGLGIEISPRL